MKLSKVAPIKDIGEEARQRFPRCRQAEGNSLPITSESLVRRIVCQIIVRPFCSGLKKKCLAQPAGDERHVSLVKLGKIVRQISERSENAELEFYPNKQR